MHLLKKINLRRWFLLGFALLCVALNVAVYALSEKSNQVAESKQWVKHTYDVIHRTDNLFFKIQDMQIALRGYLMTGNENFLGPYKTDDQTFNEQFAALVNLTSDNINRKIDFQKLQEIFDKQRALMARQIKTRHRTGSYIAADMDTSKKLMDDIRALSVSVVEDEQKLLNERAERENARQRNYMRAIFGTAGISILGLLLANALIGFLSLRRIEAENNLRRINTEMEGFTYIASHDLRSPLVNLKGFASEMARGLKEIAPVIERALPHMETSDRKIVHDILQVDIPDSLQYIHTSVEKMNKLTNGILELSRIGKRNLRIAAIDMNLLVQKALEVVQHQITTKNIRVTVHNLPTVVSDVLSVEQVFGNVIDNAIKYLDPARPGIIEIGGARGRTQTTFWIRDNGRGISTIDLEKIFEIYRRAGSNQNIPGEGLGMAYVRTTLRRLGGRIWVDSKLDVGSVFYFTVDNVLKKEGNKDA